MDLRPITHFQVYSLHLQSHHFYQNGVNPITQRTSQFLEQNEGFGFPSQSFVFVAYIGDSKGMFIQNTPQQTYYTIQFIKKVSGLFGLQTNITQIGFGECSDTQLEIYSKYGAVLPKQVVSCIPEEYFLKENAMEIQNSIHLQNFTKFQFEVFRCVNSTTANYTCASEEEIDAKLSNAIIQFSFPFYEFNSLNYSSPYERKIGIKLTINTQNTKVMKIIYKQSQTFTEQNIFYFFPSQRKDVGIEYHESYVDIQSDTIGGYLGGVEFTLDDMKFVYQRTYQNILNIFGALGGTFSVLRALFVILLSPLQKLYFAQFMFNKISNKKKIKIQDYFKSKGERSVIDEYYNIIQKAIELESYMEIMLKYENDLLTFRSDKLALQNAELFKSQILINSFHDKENFKTNRMSGDQQQIDQIEILQQQSEEVLSARQIDQGVISQQKSQIHNYDYVVNDER